jgi:hypothetical protein
MRLTCLIALKKKILLSNLFPAEKNYRIFLQKNMPVKFSLNFSQKNPGNISQIPGIFYIPRSPDRALQRKALPFSVVYRRKNDTRSRRGRPFVRVLSATPRFTGVCWGRRSAIQRGPKRHILGMVFTDIVQTEAVLDFIEKQGHTFSRMRHKKICKRGKRSLKSPPLIASPPGGCVPGVLPLDSLQHVSIPP